MSRQPRHKKVARTSKGFKRPRICIDSLPTNCSFIFPTMSRSNMSCGSCMCPDEEEDTPCCADRSTQSKPERCCQSNVSLDPLCAMCMESLSRLAEAQDQSCPACSRPKSPKAKEKPKRCPSCAQPVAKQGGSDSSPRTVSVIIIPENLLKGLEDDKKDPCCAIETCKSNKQEPKKVEQPRTPPPCCPLDTCKSNKKEKVVEKPKPMCDEECAAMNEPPCCCVFPPAYKQYSCVGLISGTCECEKTHKD